MAEVNSFFGKWQPTGYRLGLNFERSGKYLKIVEDFVSSVGYGFTMIGVLAVLIGFLGMYRYYSMATLSSLREKWIWELRLLIVKLLSDIKAFNDNANPPNNKYMDISFYIMGSRGLVPLQGGLRGGGAAPFFLLSYIINYRQVLIKKRTSE
ncbi:MAG: hypothetical protein HQL04_01185 [Nitrospirae bacterium]|nr:hypothetical protein [Nitrospirota bacterium]